MDLSLDATIHISLRKNQKGQTIPHRANTLPSSSATEVSEGEEMGHSQAWGPPSLPPQALCWTQALEKTAL